MAKFEEIKNGVIFSAGEENPYGDFFIGKSYLNMLTMKGVAIGNVTFEPGCRNNWHSHNGGGQILLATGGRGWYQEWEKEPRELHAGEVVVIPVGIKHWHGAASDSWFAHIAVEVPGDAEGGGWFEPVSDGQYAKVNA